MPIKLVNKEIYADEPILLRKMFAHRKKVFCNRLKWVECPDDFEIDVFDICAHPLYMISLDDEGNYCGSCRLLPTTGPNMLRDVPEFTALLNCKTPDEDDIWECSRICGNSEALLEMVLGMGEYGLQIGLNCIVAVFDERIRRILHKTGVEFMLRGSGKINDRMCHVGLFDVSRETQVELNALLLERGTVLA
jgi:acyl homoserine lactone synthase